MPADSYSSDDETDGGAPLHPSLVTPDQTHHEGSKSESPSDEEKALVRASANFGSLKDPFAETPDVPQSIPANSYTHRSSFTQPTPSRGNNGFNRFGNVQSANRYRSSTTVVGNPAPRFRPGMAGVPFNSGIPLSDEPDLQFCQQVFASIMTATQYVNVSPGMSSQTQTQLTHILHDISQGFSTATVQLRRQRDEANRAREDEHERYKRATQELEELRKTFENLQALNKALVPQLTHITEREKLLKDHIRDLKEQLRITQKQLETLAAEAGRFHEHHDKVIQDYKEQDEKHFKAMTELKNEVKALRSNARASHAGLYSSPTHPLSINNVADGESDSNSPNAQKLSQEDSAMLLEGLHKTAENRRYKRDSFVPNPQAPAWAPPGQLASSSRPSPQTIAEQQQQQEDSSSANSGEVILYTGHGNQSRAVTPYMGTPAQKQQQRQQNQGGNSSGGGGAPAFIRTPFGIV
ncbi:hypothetical protein ONZ43_g7340 [Nemania bipapillata]|uniref:Uncharacterized protein n=1 Tax=Nemania bipapillata TaxID=110536 RepID=A0ACC2HSB2_9PEZI|nr:hypothetical protein ONZ43_g7340 [Nemania bipapillata]